MKEKIKDTIVDLLFDGVKEKLDCVKENYKWQKLFVSTGDFFVNNPDVLVKFEDDLYSVFSKDNLIRIAKRLKDNNGYDFSQLLHNELYDLMVSYEIPIMETETYIHHFMQVIITYLEENDSDKALEMFLGDMRKEIGTYFAALESKLELVLNQISNLNKEKITTYSIADIDAQIRRETKYKGMGLDFFKLDDEQFESKFQNSLNDTKVYVVGKSREETTYRILNELKNKNSKRITLVVKSEKEWNKLQHSNLSGNILVPFFYADSIVVIPNNTNIFIYGEDEPCYTQNKLVLRKRTKRNIIDSLEELGIDANEAYKMVDNTHGLYVPLKKKLFDGAMYDKPDWIEGHSDVVIAALLCGKWTEATGDVLVFEELSGKAYSDCKKELGKYLHRENPYIVSNNSYRGSNMQLASVEDAWEELDLYINDEMWDKFISLFYEVLIESEPIFEYPFEKHFEASIYAKKPEWSPTLKKGMIRTLIMRAYYRGHEENQKQIDNIVAKVLDTITSKERWGYISQYLPELCEASPESVLRKLESEIEVSQGLIDLFAEKDGDFMTSRHYYTNVLWAVEQLIQQKKYVATAAGMLMFGDEFNIVRHFPEYFLDYREMLDPTIRWTDRLQSSSGEWSGNICDFYFRVYNKIIKDIKVPFKTSGGDRIDDTPVHEALREALANCLINTDYYGVRGVVIKKEPDKLILENPGYIRTGKEQMRKGGESDPRNKALMKMFNLINIGERAGSGVPNIFNVWEDEGWIEPVIEEKFDPDRTILTLEFKKKSGDKKATKKSDDKKATKKSDGKKVTKKTQAQYDKILDFMEFDKEYSLQEFCELLDLKETRTKAILKQLNEYIEPIGSTKNRKYLRKK